MPRTNSSSVAIDEIERFSALAEDWWNPDGAFRFLHKMSLVRISYIEKRVYSHFRKAATCAGSLKGLSVLDAGCGGGLLAEAMAERGAKVTGIDASEATIKVARRHAAKRGLKIDYRCGAVEDAVKGRERFDVVTAMEVVEHVPEPDSFLKSLISLMKPEGLLILATVSRTARSFFLGVLAAEYVLNWIPPGTHRWSKFLRPSELVAKLETFGLEAENMSGVVFDPLTEAFRLSAHNLRINYLLSASRPRSGGSC